MTPVRLEPATLRSRVKHSTTEPLRSHVIATVIFLLTGRSCEYFKNLKPYFFLKGFVGAYCEPEVEASIQTMSSSSYSVGIPSTTKGPSAVHTNPGNTLLSHEYNLQLMHWQIQRAVGQVLDPLENHKLLYFSLEILVQISIEKQVDPWVQLLLDGGPYDPL